MNNWFKNGTSALNIVMNKSELITWFRSKTLQLIKVWEFAADVGAIRELLVDNLHVISNIQMLAASDPAYEDMFIRIGQNGLFSLYRMPNQDHTWEVIDDRHLAITTGGIYPLADLTLDLYPLTVENGSYGLAYTVSNTSTNKDRDLTITVYDDGVSMGSETVTILQNASNQSMFLSGTPSAEVAQNSVITVSFEASTNGDLVLNGDVSVTKLKITEAGADGSSQSVDDKPKFTQVKDAGGNHTYLDIREEVIIHTIPQADIQYAVDNDNGWLDVTVPFQEAFAVECFGATVTLVDGSGQYTTGHKHITRFANSIVFTVVIETINQAGDAVIYVHATGR